MKHFISYVYLTKSGTELYGNDIITIEGEITNELIKSIEKKYEQEVDSRLGKLKILFIRKL